MAFLNEQGVKTLWTKIKDYTGNEIEANNEIINKSINDVDAKIPTKSLTIKGEGTVVETFNGSADREVDIVAGENISIDTSNDGKIEISAVVTSVIVENAKHATTATKAEQDADGNVITETYATKDDYNNLTATVGSKAPLVSPIFTGIPKAPTPDGTVSDQIATVEFARNLFRANDAMMFKKVINSDSELPVEHDAGWTYKVGTAGTYAGNECEVGDMIICVADGTTANNADWTVIQNNIDGAVTSNIESPSDSYDGNIVIFDGATGKVITNSGTNLNNLTTSVNSKLDDNTAITADAGIEVTNNGVLKNGVKIKNTGIRTLDAGAADGTTKVNGTDTTIVKGLKSAAYKEDTYFATTTVVNNLSTSKQDKIVNSDDITIGTDNKLTIAVITDDFINGLQ